MRRTFFLEALQKRIMSSAKSRCVGMEIPLAAEIGAILPSSTFFLNVFAQEVLWDAEKKRRKWISLSNTPVALEKSLRRTIFNQYQKISRLKNCFNPTNNPLTKQALKTLMMIVSKAFMISIFKAIFPPKAFVSKALSPLSSKSNAVLNLTTQK